MVFYKWDVYVEELKKSSRIAAPMVVVAVFQYLLQVSSVMMVGHLGEVSLSAVAIATSFTNVTGFSLLSGMAGGLETLCGQAYGAQQYKKLATYTYSGIISLILISTPICISWIFIDKFLILINQDPLISHEAKKYSVYVIPALFGSAILKPLTRFFQTQSLIVPMLICSLVILCVHVPLCWILVFKVKLGIIGAAIAFSFSCWFNVILLGVYMIFSSSCEKTLIPFSRDAFYGVGEFFRYGVPSAVMVCLKWWSLEILILLSGVLPNPKLETSVLSICLTISTLHFTIPYGFGVAASTRVSNELGAGNPKGAKLAVGTMTSLAIIEAVIVSVGVFLSRHVLGYAYSNESQVVKYVSIMTPLLCLSIIMDSLQAVISGVARGSGWQHIGAYVNLGAYYIVGLPVAAMFGFVLHLKVKGFWIGIVVGSGVQLTLLALITYFTNWQIQASKAKERILSTNSS